MGDVGEPGRIFGGDEKGNSVHSQTTQNGANLDAGDQLTAESLVEQQCAGRADERLGETEPLKKRGGEASDAPARVIGKSNLAYRPIYLQGAIARAELVKGCVILQRFTDR